MTDIGEVDGPPSPDEVEVTLLGPGYGESVLVHIGQGRWIVVDSCIGPAREPQALDYLRSIGVEPAAAVTLIVATHWHDDHIRGMAKLVEACPDALFSCAAALRRDEFLSAIHALNRRGAFAGTSGVRELHTVFG
ncbi:MAG: MBL fold metallo-hydrolase, partial [Chloroflexota bacterium]|nr:MBL fold metallo-hydrolase [Chloroflexota bacterium]